MSIKNIKTKSELDRRRRKNPVNLLLGIIGESIPWIHISKAEWADIVNSLWELYHDYWANTKGELSMIPATDTAKITLIVICYASHIAGIKNDSQKAPDKKTCNLVVVQEELKAHTDELVRLNKRVRHPGVIMGRLTDDVSGQPGECIIRLLGRVF